MNDLEKIEYWELFRGVRYEGFYTRPYYVKKLEEFYSYLVKKYNV